MILIHTRLTDETTIEIIRWLSVNQKEFKRINFSNEFFYSISDQSKGLQLGAEKSNLLHQFRSFYFNGGNVLSDIKPAKNEFENHLIAKYLNAESDAIFSYLEEMLPGSGFGNYSFRTYPNKLSTLLLADKIGLNIPPTSVVTTKKQVRELKLKWNRIITKAIALGIDLESEEYILNGQRTEEVKDENIDIMSEYFSPSLIQKYIVKKFEVRVFWYNGTLKSVAIIPLKKKPAQIDFRSDRESLRMIPYTLKKETTSKINLLMTSLKMNYASIDLVVDENDNHIFLEVNPYGQYGFLSYAANFQLEKMIANII